MASADAYQRIQETRAAKALFGTANQYVTCCCCGQMAPDPRDKNYRRRFRYFVKKRAKEGA